MPLVLLMFFAIAILEDTGYLARVAYMLDRVFRTFGLHGSSVMAYIISGALPAAVLFRESWPPGPSAVLANAWPPC